MNEKLRNKVAVVTGAGGTLCSIIAKDLARQGASVVLVGRTARKLEAVASEIDKNGGRTMVIPIDVSDFQAVQAATRSITDQWGPCSVLINGAGGNQTDAISTINEFNPEELKPGSGIRGFFNLDPTAFLRVIEVNIMGTVLATQAFGAVMAIHGGGSIVNFASMNSFRALSCVSAYAAAKSGIVRLTEWLAAYLAPAKIRVNAIAPGFFINDRSRNRLLKDDGTPTDRGRQILHHTPMKAFGQATQLLGCVNWLIDDDASGFVTGITVPVDGGFLACPGI
jgi:NAD(P)-dependent dehydrogenase (short-subunit alcohol dehydrogenase family)